MVRYIVPELAVASVVEPVLVVVLDLAFGMPEPFVGQLVELVHDRSTQTASCHAVDITKAGRFLLQWLAEP